MLADLEQLPVHLVKHPLLFSMDDLLRAKKGQLVAPAQLLLQSAIEHVANCEVSLKGWQRASAGTKNMSLCVHVCVHMCV